MRKLLCFICIGTSNFKFSRHHAVNHFLFAVDSRQHPRHEASLILLNRNKEHIELIHLKIKTFAGKKRMEIKKKDEKKKKWKSSQKKMEKRESRLTSPNNTSTEKQSVDKRTQSTEYTQ
jgi:UPF0288 family protein (methanogenesis marker protein 3)